MAEVAIPVKTSTQYSFFLTSMIHVSYYRIPAVNLVTQKGIYPAFDRDSGIRGREKEHSRPYIIYYSKISYMIFNSFSNMSFRCIFFCLSKTLFFFLI